MGGKPPQKEQIYIAILGQVFDVSKAPQFYSEWQQQRQQAYANLMQIVLLQLQQQQQRRRRRQQLCGNLQLSMCTL
jgi:hypothetical protein